MEGSKTITSKGSFLDSLYKSVYANLNNDQFTVEQLAREIGMSRSQIHRNLHLLMGKSITQFIREIRLSKALKILNDDRFSVSEVAYQVGFNSPTYFSRCFHDHFGITPGQARLNGVIDELFESGYELNNTSEVFKSLERPANPTTQLHDLIAVNSKRRSSNQIRAIAQEPKLFPKRKLDKKTLNLVIMHVVFLLIILVVFILYAK